MLSISVDIRTRIHVFFFLSKILGRECSVKLHSGSTIPEQTRLIIIITIIIIIIIIIIVVNVLLLLFSSIFSRLFFYRQ